MKSYLHVLVVLATNAKIADANFHSTLKESSNAYSKQFTIHA